MDDEDLRNKYRAALLAWPMLSAPIDAVRLQGDNSLAAHDTTQRLKRPGLSKRSGRMDAVSDYPGRWRRSGKKLDAHSGAKKSRRAESAQMLRG